MKAIYIPGIFLTTLTLVNAVPLEVSADKSLSSSDEATSLPLVLRTWGQASDADAIYPRQTTLSGNRPMGQGFTYATSTGLTLVVSALSVARTVGLALPAMNGQIQDSLSDIGTNIIQSGATNTGIALAGTNIQANLQWSSPSGVTPNLAQVDWDTILWSMYRVLPVFASTEQNQVKATIAIGTFTSYFVFTFTQTGS